MGNYDEQALDLSTGYNCSILKLWALIRGFKVKFAFKNRAILFKKKYVLRLSSHVKSFNEKLIKNINQKYPRKKVIDIRILKLFFNLGFWDKQKNFVSV